MIRPAPGSIPGRCIFALLTACRSKIFGLACVVLLAVWGNDVGEVDWEEGRWIRGSSAGLPGIAMVRMLAGRYWLDVAFFDGTCSRILAWNSVIVGSV